MNAESSKTKERVLEKIDKEEEQRERERERERERDKEKRFY